MIRVCSFVLSDFHTGSRVASASATSPSLTASRSSEPSSARTSLIRRSINPMRSWRSARRSTRIPLPVVAATFTKSAFSRRSSRSPACSSARSSPPLPSASSRAWRTVSATI